MIVGFAPLIASAVLALAPPNGDVQAEAWTPCFDLVVVGTYLENRAIALDQSPDEWVVEWPNRMTIAVEETVVGPGQASRLEGQQQHIQNQEKADMAAHNGHLTKPEQRQLNREQNRASRRIYNDKHDK